MIRSKGNLCNRKFSKRCLVKQSRSAVTNTAIVHNQMHTINDKLEESIMHIPYPPSIDISYYIELRLFFRCKCDTILRSSLNKPNHVPSGCQADSRDFSSPFCGRTRTPRM